MTRAWRHQTANEVAGGYPRRRGGDGLSDAGREYRLEWGHPGGCLKESSRRGVTFCSAETIAMVVPACITRRGRSTPEGRTDERTRVSWGMTARSISWTAGLSRVGRAAKITEFVITWVISLPSSGVSRLVRLRTIRARDGTGSVSTASGRAGDRDAGQGSPVPRRRRCRTQVLVDHGDVGSS